MTPKTKALDPIAVAQADLATAEAAARQAAEAHEAVLADIRRLIDERDALHAAAQGGTLEAMGPRGEEIEAARNKAAARVPQLLTELDGLNADAARLDRARRDADAALRDARARLADTEASPAVGTALMDVRRTREALAALNSKAEKLASEATGLATEKQGHALAAHRDGDAKAKARLDDINRQLVALNLEAADIDTAIRQAEREAAEAEIRLADARGELALEKAKAIAIKIVEASRHADEALATASAALTRRAELVIALQQTGARANTSGLLSRARIGRAAGAAGLSAHVDVDGAREHPGTLAEADAGALSIIGKPIPVQPNIVPIGTAAA